MKKISTKAILALITFILISCSEKDDISKTENSSNVSGEEIFRGLYFGDGQIAKSFSHFNNFQEIKGQLSSDQNNYLSEFEQKIIDKINQNNPLLLEDLELAVKSSNPIKIKNQLNIVDKAFSNATDDIYNFKTSKAYNLINAEKSNLLIDMDKINEFKLVYNAENPQLAFKSLNVNPDQEAVSPIWVVVVGVVAVAVVEVAVVIDAAFWISGSSVPVDPPGEGVGNCRPGGRLTKECLGIDTTTPNRRSYEWPDDIIMTLTNIN